MKKKNKKKNTYKYDNKRFILVFTMMFCLVISMSTYWMYAYKHKYGKNYFDNKIISYKVSDYVDTDGNYVYLKNIDKEIINTFINEQKEVLKNNVIDMSVTKGIYKDILSIKISYVLYGELSNYEDVITINIDLKNNKVLSNDDMIDMVKGSYKDIATDIFNEYIKINNNREVVDAITEEKLSSSEFNNNSEKYIIRIREKLPEIMNIYIENNEVYYLVRKYEINKVCYYTNTDINMGYINKKIEKTIDEAIRNSSYSEINLYYNHYNSSTSFEFKKLTLFPINFDGEYDTKNDFVIETDITSMLYSLLTFYIMYELKMCECISRAAENVIRNQITREALDKIDELEIEQANQLRKNKKEKLVKKTVENFKKISTREEEDE